MAPSRLTMVIAGVAAGLGACGLPACGSADAANGEPKGVSSREVSRAATDEDGKPIEIVTLAGEEYKLDLAADDETRIQGLSGREKIEDDEGMLFVFPRADLLQFVMRDCLVDIDIIFIDTRGKITAMHEMKVEEPRRPDEPKPEDPTKQRDPYEWRLKRYSSRFDAQFAIELRGGALKEMDPPLKVGDVVPLDLKRLKKVAE